jgi:hydrogenase expression/formation protein HypC
MSRRLLQPGDSMCLGVPGKVIEIDGLTATVDFFGVRREVRLDIVDEPVAAGDYVLNHVGYAIRKIPAAEVDATLALYDELLREAEREDLMAADVRGEMAAGEKDKDG